MNKPGPRSSDPLLMALQRLKEGVSKTSRVLARLPIEPDPIQGLPPGELLVRMAERRVAGQSDLLDVGRQNLRRLRIRHEVLRPLTRLFEQVRVAHAKTPVAHPARRIAELVLSTETIDEALEVLELLHPLAGVHNGSHPPTYAPKVQLNKDWYSRKEISKLIDLSVAQTNKLLRKILDPKCSAVQVRTKPGGVGRPEEEVSRDVVAKLLSSREIDFDSRE